VFYFSAKSASQTKTNDVNNTVEVKVKIPPHDNPF